MYTEISHYFLLYAIFLANVVALWVARITPRGGIRELSNEVSRSASTGALAYYASPRCEASARHLFGIFRRAKRWPHQRVTSFMIRALRRLRLFLVRQHAGWEAGLEEGASCQLVHQKVVYNSGSPEGRLRANWPLAGEAAKARSTGAQRLWTISIYFLILTSCFFGTISNYVCSDFSTYNILTNSTADVPLFYKISATWSNHEGSLLLWCWLLSFNSFLFCISVCTKTMRAYRPRSFTVNSLQSRPRKREAVYSKEASKRREAPISKRINQQASKRAPVASCQLAGPVNFSGAIVVASNLYFWGPLRALYFLLGGVRSINGGKLAGINSHQKKAARGGYYGYCRYCRYCKQPLATGAKRLALLPLRDWRVIACIGGAARSRLFKERAAPPIHAVVCNSGNSMLRGAPASRPVQAFSSQRLPQRLFTTKLAQGALACKVACNERQSFKSLWMCAGTRHFEPEPFIAGATFTASLILLFFTSFLVYTSNPFIKTSIPCITSLAELNPILQDPVLAIHPPCIYAGYVASAIAFSLCFAKPLGAKFYRQVR